MKRWERLELLQRRADFLAERMVKQPERELTFDRAELSALLWAIKELNCYRKLKDSSHRNSDIEHED